MPTSKQGKLKSGSSENVNLHLGAHPRVLRRAARRALLGGYAVGARQLGGYPTSIRRLDDGVALPQLLGADPPASVMAGIGPWPPPATRGT
jgi:hypothetical protein